MRTGFRALLCLTSACLAGFAASEFLYRYPPAKEAIERLVVQFGDEGVERNAEILIEKSLRSLAGAEPLAAEEINREFDLVQAQFGDEKQFETRLKASGLTRDSLRAELAENLRARAWLEKEIAPRLSVTEAEVRARYEMKPELFLQPKRFRVSHIFAAAPDGTSPEVIAAKQSFIQNIGIRLLAREDFAQLAAEASEDEATKRRGGDLGYFGAGRMPPELIAEVEKLRVGELSGPVRSHLGFHILRLVEAKPPRPLSYEEARAEIQLSLGNEKRLAAVAELRARLRAQ